jgi:hypothetical protein
MSFHILTKTEALSTGVEYEFELLGRGEYQVCCSCGRNAKSLQGHRCRYCELKTCSACCDDWQAAFSRQVLVDPYNRDAPEIPSDCCEQE